MARIIREREEVPEDEFREVIVDRDRPVERTNNTGWVVAAVIIGIVLLLLLFGRGFMNRSTGGTTNVTLPSTPTTTTK